MLTVTGKVAITFQLNKFALKCSIFSIKAACQINIVAVDIHYQKVQHVAVMYTKKMFFGQLMG